MNQPRLFALPTDTVMISVQRTPGGYSVVVRACERGGLLLESPTDLYDDLCHLEMVDVVCASLDGFEAVTS